MVQYGIYPTKGNTWNLNPITPYPYGLNPAHNGRFLMQYLPLFAINVKNNNWRGHLVASIFEDTLHTPTKSHHNLNTLHSFSQSLTLLHCGAVAFLCAVDLTLQNQQVSHYCHTWISDTYPDQHYHAKYGLKSHEPTLLHFGMKLSRRLFARIRGSSIYNNYMLKFFLDSMY